MKSIIFFLSWFIICIAFSQDSTLVEFYEFQKNPTKTILYESEVLDSMFSGSKNVKLKKTFLINDGLKYNIEDHSYETDTTILDVKIDYLDGLKIKVIAYFDNGQKYVESNFNEEGLTGVVTTWYQNGFQKSYAVYSNGKIVSPFIMWYDNGNFYKYDDSENNKLNIKEWYYNGVLGREIVGIDSIEGKFHEKIYSPRGHIISEGIFNDGEQIYKKYWDNGNLQKQGKIFNLSLQKLGKWEEWHENGQLKEELHYHDSIPNLRVGKWKYWNEKGELIKEEKYENDELIDTKEYLPLKKLNKE